MRQKTQTHREIDISEIKKSIEKTLKKHVRSKNFNNWWQRPIIGVSCSTKSFTILKRVVRADHLQPDEILKSARAVIAFFLPFKRQLIDENSTGLFPSQSWATAYEQTNEMIEIICKELKTFFEKSGMKAKWIAPTDNFDENTLTSIWSHKHVGFLCGLGSFGVNGQLITPSGCAGRIGSIVTEATVRFRKYKTHQRCIYKVKGDCLQCIKSCPAGAISKEGVDRVKCYSWLNYCTTTVKGLASIDKNSLVCGKCACATPCSTYEEVKSSEPGS